MNTPPHLQALAQALVSFIQLLEREAAVLAANQADDLPPLIEQREVANRQLASHWQALAKELHLSSDAPLAALRARCRELDPEAWGHVEESIRHAERMNRQNSRLIDELLRRTQAAVQVLRNAAGGRTLYGADGQVSDLYPTNRSIDSA